MSETPDEQDTSPPSGPLAGVRILDLSSVVSGPMAAVVLADQGADVIKVEPPMGDASRYHRGVNNTLAADAYGIQ